MNSDAVLPTRRLDGGATMTQAEPWAQQRVGLDSPALAVMTDLARVKAATTGPATRLAQAEQLMIYQGVRMLFVVERMPQVLGLVTHADLEGDRAMRVVQQRGLHHDEITVADVMTELDALNAVDLAAVRTAQVSQVVATLKALGRHHLLVVERSAEAGAAPATRIVGVFSRSQVARQLGMAIDVIEVAGSFAELKAMLS
jgi:CBS-domain-containing membrane protein